MIQLKTNSINVIALPKNLSLCEGDSDMDKMEGYSCLILRKIINNKSDVVFQEKDYSSVEFDKCSNIENIGVKLPKLAKGEYLVKYISKPHYKFVTIANVK